MQLFHEECFGDTETDIVTSSMESLLAEMPCWCSFREAIHLLSSTSPVRAREDPEVHGFPSPPKNLTKLIHLSILKTSSYQYSSLSAQAVAGGEE